MNNVIEKAHELNTQVLHIDKKPNFRPPTPVRDEPVVSAPIVAPVVPIQSPPTPDPITIEETPEQEVVKAPEVPQMKEEKPVIPDEIPDPGPPVVDPKAAPSDLLLPHSDINRVVTKESEPDSQNLHYDRKQVTKPPAIEELKPPALIEVAQ